MVAAEHAGDAVVHRLPRPRATARRKNRAQRWNQTQRMNQMQRTNESRGVHETQRANGNGFWSRVGHWIRGGGATPNGDAGAEATAAAEAVVDPAVAAIRSAVADVRSDLSRRGATLGELVRVCKKLAGAVESIDKRLLRRDELADGALRSLDHLTDPITRLPVLAKTQADALERIAKLLEHGDARGRKVEEHLSQWPQLADAQRELMVSIGRRLDDAAAGDDRRGAAVAALQSSLAALDKTIDGLSATLRHVHAEMIDRQEAIATRMAEQTRRLTWFVGGAVVTAVAAGTVAVVALVR